MRFFCPWDFPGKNTGVGCHFLLQGILPTQELNLRLLHWQAGSLLFSPRGKLKLEDAAAVAAKSLQSCPTLCDPIDGGPPGSPVPGSSIHGIFQARVLEWGAIAFSETLCY